MHEDIFIDVLHMLALSTQTIVFLPEAMINIHSEKMYTLRLWFCWGKNIKVPEQAPATGIDQPDAQTVWARKTSVAEYS